MRSLPSAFALVLQLLWSFAALTILPVALDMLPLQYSLTKSLPHIPHSHVDVVSGAAAAVAFIGELFMIKAMLVYDDRRGGTGEPSKLSKVRAGWRLGLQNLIQQHTAAAAAAAVAMGGAHTCLPVGCDLSLSVAVQALVPSNSRSCTSRHRL